MRRLRVVRREIPSLHQALHAKANQYEPMVLLSAQGPSCLVEAIFGMGRAKSSTIHFFTKSFRRDRLI